MLLHILEIALVVSLSDLIVKKFKMINMKNLVSLIIVHVTVSMVLQNLFFKNLELIIEYAGGQAIITDKRPAI